MTGFFIAAIAVAGAGILLFFPVPIKTNVFFDLLSGKLLIYAGLPPRIRKTIIRGRYDGCGIEVYLFNKNIFPGDKCKDKKKAKSGNDKDKHKAKEKEEKNKLKAKNKKEKDKQKAKSKKINAKNKKKGIDIIRLIRIIALKVLTLDALAGSCNNAAFSFYSSFINNIFYGGKDFIEKRFNIEKFNVNVVPDDADSFKLQLNINVDFYLFKGLMILFSLRTNNNHKFKKGS